MSAESFDMSGLVRRGWYPTTNLAHKLCEQVCQRETALIKAWVSFFQLYD